MNTSQIKQALMRLAPGTPGFTVIFSGKASRKVDGLYKPDSREIVIHNRNFRDDNALMYTAIHELAHHLHMCSSPVPVSSRAHTSLFWSTLHDLLEKAEKKGIYTNLFKKDREFVNLTVKIREKFLSGNGRLMKEFGSWLFKAETLCEKKHACFDDYVDRELNLHRTAARMIMRVSARNIDPGIGYENMKIVAGIRDTYAAKKAERAFLSGKSPDSVKQEFKAPSKERDRLEELVTEKKRLESMIRRLESKLDEIRKVIARERGK